MKKTSILDDDILDDAIQMDSKDYSHIKPLVGTPRAEGHDHGVDFL